MSCVLMTMDHQFNYFNRVRSTLSLVVAPVQYLVDRPVSLMSWVETSFTTQQNLLMENAQLRARQLLLYAKLQKAAALEHENDQLRALLRSSTSIHEKVTVARLLAVDLAPYTQQIIIDKGERDGVYLGQPVLDAYGVMGQIIAVAPVNSRVLLITDSRSAIPVQNSRNGNRAIATGLGFDGVLELVNIPITIDFHQGDFLVTSGLGGHYPPGYPVGIISNIKLSQGERFAAISVMPSAHVNQSRQVLLVWPKEKNLLPDRIQPAAPKKQLKDNIKKNRTNKVLIEDLNAKSEDQPTDEMGTD
jgi:rod shape-determining protein MreC